MYCKDQQGIFDGGKCKAEIEDSSSSRTRNWTNPRSGTLQKPTILLALIGDGLVGSLARVLEFPGRSSSLGPPISTKGSPTTSSHITIEIWRTSPVPWPGFTPSSVPPDVLSGLDTYAFRRTDRVIVTMTA
ncbi:hypothetical protein J6590_026879 [Homalodisca vitripennis]|nr:hypothetical protein J6590_026879 [Homalodisca vitripennis]